MAERKKNRFSGAATTDAEIRQREEQAYRNSGIAESNRRQGVEAGQRKQPTTRKQSASVNVSNIPNTHALGAGGSERRVSNGVETLMAAQAAMQNNGAADTGGEKKGILSFLTEDRSKDKNPKMPDMRPIGGVILDMKPGEAATRAGEATSSSMKGWLSGQANTLAFLLGQNQEKANKTRSDFRDYAIEHGYAKPGDFEESKADAWMSEASRKLGEGAKKLSDEASAHEEVAKDGLGKIGQLLVDAGIAGTQLVADASIGNMTGTGMAALGTRTFGQATRRAEDAGGTRNQAAAYGVGSAALGVLSNKLFDIGKVFGGGVADDMFEKVVEKWAKSDAGRSAIRTFFGVVSEGAEEDVEDLLDPVLQSFYNSNAVKETYGTAAGRQQLWSDLKHDFAIGGALGGSSTVVTGQNARANAELRAREQARQSEAEAARIEQNRARQQAQAELFASNTMQTGTADAEAAEVLRRNAELRGETLQNAQNAPVSHPTVADNNTAENTEAHTQDNLTERTAQPAAVGDDLDARAKQAFIENEQRWLAEEGAPQSDINDVSQHERMWDVASESDKFSAYVQALEKGNPNFDIEAVWNDSKSYAVWAFINDLVAHGGDLSPKAGAQVFAEYFESGKFNPVRAIQRAYELDGKPIPDGIRREYMPTAEERAQRDAENERYRKEIEKYKEANAKARARRAAQSDAEIMRDAIGVQTFDDAQQMAQTAPAAPQVSPEDSTGAAPLGYDPYSNWQNQADEYHPEGENAARQVDLPTENLQGQRTMKGGQTVMEAQSTTDERANQIAQAYVDGKMAYVSIGNEELAQNAEAKIERHGFQKSYVDWTAEARSGKVSDELVAMGATLINNAGNAGMPVEQYLELVTDFVVMSHKASTALQAVRILKSLTPQSRLYTMQRSIYSIAEECGIEDAMIPAELAQAYLDAETEAERDKIVTEIQKEIAKRVPSTLMDKWNALRYTNMLGNFKTQVRNLMGNTVMGLTAATKRRMQAVFGLAQNAAGGQRDVAAFYRPSLGTAAWNDFENVKSIAKGEAKFSDVGGALSKNQFLRGIMDERQIFKLMPLEEYRKVTKWAMEKGDDVFIRMTYADAMAQYLAAHGVKTTEQMQNADQSVLDAARAFAIQEAQEATFHDDNGFSNWVSKMGRRQDTWKPLKVVSEGVMPFRKTPANILVRGVEYSPIGAAASLVKTVQAKAGKGNVTANDAINSWAKTATGSAVLLAGWALARAGLLHGKFDDDKEQAAFEKQTGHQEYALEINGTSITLDWCSPTVMPLLVGGELYRLGEDGGLNMKNIEAALASLADPMINMSMLQGVNDTLDGIKYSDNSLIQMGEKAIVGYFTQGLTNTLLGQIERSMEPNRMTTYVDNEGFLPDWLQREVGKASAKTPGLDYNQAEYMNAWGEKQSNGELLARLANNLLNPSYVSKISDSKVDAELARLHEATGDDSIYPNAYAAPDSLKVGGASRKLTQKQKETYQKTYGDIYSDGVKTLLSAAGYQDMSNADKVATLKSIEDYALDMAKQTVAPGYEISSASEKANEAEDEIGMSPVEYLLMIAGMKKYNDDGEGKLTQAETEAALDDLLDDEDDRYNFWNFYGNVGNNGGWSAKNNPYKGD